MLNRILIIGIALLTGLNVVAAQEQPVSDSCDPYGIGASPVNIHVADLTASSLVTTDTIQQRIGVNPDVYVRIADNITETSNAKADFADPNSGIKPASHAIVTNAGDRLRVYAGICTSASVLGELWAGQSVTVLDGPLASEGHAWWRVRRNDLTGWVMESNGGELWLRGA